jgi:hypothetical protein
MTETVRPLRYVVLRHSNVGEPHFDLMFETLPGSMLATWRSENWPIEHPTAVTRLRDHRRLYLDYEGDLSDQRGTVYRVAEGTCQVTIGEGSVWAIRLLTGVPSQTFLFRQLDGERWEVTPK